MPRVLLLLPTTTYRTKAFLDAALKLGVEVVAASERKNTLAASNPDTLLTLSFFDPEEAGREVLAYNAKYPIDAIIPVDDNTAVIAAHLARSIGLKHNSLESTEAARNKHRMRTALKSAVVRAPAFTHFSLDDNIDAVAEQISYPSVVKPVSLSTSRGVMRADDRQQFVYAVHRLDRILSLPEVSRRAGASSRDALVEEFIPGFEVAVEGMVTDGLLRVLAIFDKPDPLNGPFFEETIYVTPSSLQEEVQDEIQSTTSAAVRAMGLTHGPIHAELRVNESGAWVIEVAARTIGGLCSRTLRFTDGVSLEELIILHALHYDTSNIERERSAAGVMMIPIPRAGVLRHITGVEEALRVKEIEDVVITAHITQELLPPPEGASYLGFIFSRAELPARAEAALREAHSLIQFSIE